MRKRTKLYLPYKQSIKFAKKYSTPKKIFHILDNIELSLSCNSYDAEYVSQARTYYLVRIKEPLNNKK